MNISSALQTFGAFAAPAVSTPVPAVSADYVLERIRAMGVAHVGVVPNYTESIPLAHILDENSRVRPGLFVLISPSVLEQFMNDPEFREMHFERIQHAVSELGGNKAGHMEFREFNGELWGRLMPMPVGAKIIPMENGMGYKIVDESEKPDNRPAIKEEQNGYSLSEALIQKFSAQFSLTGELLAMENDEQLNTESPDFTLRKQEFVERMRQHLPTPVQRSATGETVFSEGISVFQRRGQENPNGISSNLSAATVTDITKEHLQTGLHQAANAFAIVSEGIEPHEKQYAEAAFFHILNSYPTLSRHFSRLNLNSSNTDVAALDSESIKQLHEESQRQIDSFGETFLIKFRQYGLEDGFNVAWAMLLKDM
jgi:hypothetical protein